MMKILSVGMACCDIPISPIPRDILQKDSADIVRPIASCGGDALNVALGLAKLGIPVSIAARVGADENGAFLRETCRRTGVDTSALMTDSACATATSYVLIDEDGERHFLTNKEIFGRLTAEDVPDEQLQQHDLLYFGSAMALQQMNEGGLTRLLRRAKAAGMATAMDTAADERFLSGDWLKKLEPALRCTDYFLPSLDEAKLILKTDNPSEMARILAPFGLKAFAVKLGKRGCYITDFRTERVLPSRKNIKVVDTTGAGDSFVAGFLCAIAHDYDIFESALFANTVASLNVEHVGGTGGIPTFEKAQSVYRQWVEDTFDTEKERNKL